jgi:hypothetical protein
VAAFQHASFKETLWYKNHENPSDGKSHIRIRAPLSCGTVVQGFDIKVCEYLVQLHLVPVIDNLRMLLVAQMLFF